MADQPDVVAILLHGGGEHGQHRPHAWSGPVLRMVPFGWAIHRAASHHGARARVVRVRNTTYGWNGTGAGPLADARRAIEASRTAYAGVPIVLVGHSMGGRVALRLAEEEGVEAVVALAPWIADGDPVRGRPGQTMLLLHGRQDRVTDPRRTKAYAARLRERGVDVTEATLPDGHAMLRVPGDWHRQVANFVLHQGGEADHRQGPAKVNDE